nr:hypothetical protein [Haloarchaeobius amylolyticus]
MSESVVRVALGPVVERLVRLLQGVELGGGVRVVVEVRMVLSHLVPERLLDLLLGGVLVQFEEVVEVHLVVGHE